MYDFSNFVLFKIIFKFVKFIYCIECGVGGKKGIYSGKIYVILSFNE